MNWGDLQVKQTPFILPPVFEGDRVIVYGYLPEKVEKATRVKLEADTSEGPLECEVEIDPKCVMEGKSIVRLAAKSMIRDLEEEKSYHGSNGKQSEIDQEIIQLSIL